MKAVYQNEPAAVQCIGQGRHYVNMGIRAVARTAEGETVTEWECEQVEVSGEPTYAKVVEALIRERYSVSDELAVIRQRDTKPVQFVEYDRFAERCKGIACAVFFPESGGE